VTETEVLNALLAGDISERGLLPYSSNHSFLALVRHEALEIPVVYKPQRGENPLWDFEWGTLCKRETAAYLVSHAVGWDLVPPTVLRNASRGLGSVQFYVDHDSDAHYFTFQADARHADALRRLALFDAIINNADRKSGHCLVGSAQRLWAIDHGLTFHTEYKLRTVLWEFGGEPIGQSLLDDLDDLRMQLVADDSDLTQQLRLLLSDAERRAFLQRIKALIRQGCFPMPVPQRRNYPWPPV
jgi:uncharacterized repeat protein (TIGR03843 family)